MAKLANRTMWTRVKNAFIRIKFCRNCYLQTDLLHHSCLILGASYNRFFQSRGRYKDKPKSARVPLGAREHQRTLRQRQQRRGQGNGLRDAGKTSDRNSWDMDVLEESRGQEDGQDRGASGGHFSLTASL